MNVDKAHVVESNKECGNKIVIRQVKYLWSTLSQEGKCEEGLKQTG